MVKLGNLSTEAVIFDFDGVIVDTEPLHYQAFQTILEPLSLGFTWDEYVATYMGFDDRDAFNEAFSAGNQQLEAGKLAHLVNLKAIAFQDIIKSGVTPYPGVCEIIRHIHTLHMPLAICSGALRSDILPILASLSLIDCFDLIVTAEDVAKSKPDPECYSLAYEKLFSLRSGTTQFNRRTTIAIEDTPAGIRSASQAGLHVIAVTNSYHYDRLSQADLIVDSLTQLLI